MILVEVIKQDQMIHELEITGHAYAGDPGFDLVCAGVSAIATGMLNALDQQFADLVELTLVEGADPLIKIKVNQSNESLQLVLQVLITQLETIQVSYSDSIHISRRNNS